MQCIYLNMISSSQSMYTEDLQGVFRTSMIDLFWGNSSRLLTFGNHFSVKEN